MRRVDLFNSEKTFGREKVRGENLLEIGRAGMINDLLTQEQAISKKGMASGGYEE